MAKKTIRERVHKILVDQFGGALGVVKDKTTLEDMGGCSLDEIELVMEIEDEFDISITDEDAEKLRTVGQWVEYLTKRVKES